MPGLTAPAGTLTGISTFCTAEPVLTVVAVEAIDGFSESAGVIVEVDADREKGFERGVR